MADQDADLDAPQEPSSDASVPDEEVPETPSGDEPSEPEAEPPSDEEPDEEPEPPSDDEDDEAWKNFQKKFEHFKSERDRKAAMGRAWWEKTRYASTIRKENEELKVRLARLEGARDEKPETPPAPPPELARIDGRIQELYTKDQKVQEQQNASLIALSQADKDLAIIEDRLKDPDTDEYRKAILEQKLETAKIRREHALDKVVNLGERRQSISLEMEQRLSDRDWTQKFLQEKATREQDEQRNASEFDEQFPVEVDRLIFSAADDLGAPKDDKVRKSLWRAVNRAVMVDLMRAGDEGIQEVNVPAMVRLRVKEHLEDLDLARRKTFTKTSSDKLQASSRPQTPAAPAPAKPKVVSAALLTQGGLSPAMRRARQILTQRFG